MTALRRLETTVKRKRREEKSDFKKIMLDHHTAYTTSFASEKVCSRTGKGTLFCQLDRRGTDFLQLLLEQVSLPGISWFVNKAFQEEFIPSLSLYFNADNEGWLTLGMTHYTEL
jgi:hypothetical protein